MFANLYFKVKQNHESVNERTDFISFYSEPHHVKGFYGYTTLLYMPYTMDLAFVLTSCFELYQGDIMSIFKPNVICNMWNLT